MSNHVQLDEQLTKAKREEARLRAIEAAHAAASAALEELSATFGGPTDYLTDRELHEARLLLRAADRVLSSHDVLSEPRSPQLPREA